MLKLELRMSLHDVHVVAWYCRDWILAFKFSFVEEYGKEGLEDGGVQL